MCDAPCLLFSPASPAVIDALAFALCAAGILAGALRTPRDVSDRAEAALAGLVLNAAALVLWNSSLGFEPALVRWGTAFLPLLAIRLSLRRLAHARPARTLRPYVPAALAMLSPVCAYLLLR